MQVAQRRGQVVGQLGEVVQGQPAQVVHQRPERRTGEHLQHQPGCHALRTRQLVPADHVRVRQPRQHVPLVLQRSQGPRVLRELRARGLDQDAAEPGGVTSLVDVEGDGRAGCARAPRARAPATPRRPAAGRPSPRSSRDTSAPSLALRRPVSPCARHPCHPRQAGPLSTSWTLTSTWTRGIGQSAWAGGPPPVLGLRLRHQAYRPCSPSSSTSAAADVRARAPPVNRSSPVTSARTSRPSSSGGSPSAPRSSSAVTRPRR